MGLWVTQLIYRSPGRPGNLLFYTLKRRRQPWVRDHPGAWWGGYKRRRQPRVRDHPGAWWGGYKRRVLCERLSWGMVTDPLWEEFVSQWWIPLHKGPIIWGLVFSLLSAWPSCQTINSVAMMFMWHHCNVSQTGALFGIDGSILSATLWYDRKPIFSVNMSGLEQKGAHFTDNIFKCLSCMKIYISSYLLTPKAGIFRIQHQRVNCLNMVNNDVSIIG